jgi:hypothetical protein
LLLLLLEVAAVGSSSSVRGRQCTPTLRFGFAVGRPTAAWITVMSVGQGYHDCCEFRASIS